MFYRLNIENFLTIEKLQLDLKPGLQGFVGKNAVGKTNILTAIETLVSGKHDVKKIMDGKSEFKIKLDKIEHDEVVESIQRVQDKSSNKLTGKLGKGTPSTMLEILFDKKALNPIKMIQSDNIVDYLKTHLKVVVKKEDIKKDYIEKFDTSKNPFLECDKISDDIKVDRLSTYKDMRHVQEICDEIKQSLPREDFKPKYDIAQLDKQESYVKSEMTKIETQIEYLKEKEQDINSYKQKVNEAVNKSNNDLELVRQMQEEIKRLQTKIENVKERNKERQIEIEENLKVIEIKTNEYEEVRKKIEKVDELEEKLYKIGAQKMLAKQEQETKKQLERYSQKRKEYINIKEYYDKLDEDFKFFKYLYPKKLIQDAGLPVKDVEFREGSLYIGDRHIERLSMSEKIKVSVKLAIALAKQNGHIALCVDGLEAFDEEHLDIFISEINKCDLAVIYTRVGKPRYEHEKEIKSENV
jgi:DNA repair ATPase RecN